MNGTRCLSCGCKCGSWLLHDTIHSHISAVPEAYVRVEDQIQFLPNCLSSLLSNMFSEETSKILDNGMSKPLLSAWGFVIDVFAKMDSKLKAGNEKELLNNNTELDCFRLPIMELACSTWTDDLISQYWICSPPTGNHGLQNSATMERNLFVSLGLSNSTWCSSHWWKPPIFLIWWLKFQKSLVSKILFCWYWIIGHPTKFLWDLKMRQYFGLMSLYFPHAIRCMEHLMKSYLSVLLRTQKSDFYSKLYT